MKSKYLLSVLFVLTVRTAAAQWGVTSYMSDSNQPDIRFILPAPPAIASADYADDLIQWEWGKTLRDTERGEQADVETEYSESMMRKIMAEALNISSGISSKSTPALYRLVSRVYKTANQTPQNAKEYYMRSRPFTQMGETAWKGDNYNPYLGTKKSYPSGHTTTGWAMALAFAEMWPELQDTILRRGFEYGENRIITGAHYQSDVHAGYMSGAAAIARAHANADFESDIRAARAEYRQLKNLSDDYHPTANAGMPRGEKILNAPVGAGDYRFVGDLMRYWDAKTLRDTDLGDAAKQNANHSEASLMKLFGDIVGVTISEETTPHLATLIKTVRTACEERVTALKAVTANRKRPYVQLYEEQTLIPEDENALRTESSYVSLHACIGWALALVMTEVVPEHQNNLLKLGFDYGTQRLVAGYNWASDVEAGRMMGCVVVARMNADSDFQELLAQSRQDYESPVNPSSVPVVAPAMTKEGDFYDLSGRRYDEKPVTSGVFINNGSKLVVK